MRRTTRKHLCNHAAHGNTGNVRTLYSQLVQDTFRVSGHVFKTVLRMNGAACNVFGNTCKHARFAYGFRTEHARTAVPIIRCDDIESLAHQTRQKRFRPRGSIHPQTHQQYKRRHDRITV